MATSGRCRRRYGEPRSPIAVRRHASSTTAVESRYTASTAFFEAIWDAGITHCFVNLGSDHPAILEAMVQGKGKTNFPRIITCPNEMVAMSMADGYARVTNKPQCVLIHVDVGTQGLGAAMHNASAGRAPVFVFCGQSAFTQEGELRGTRTEWSQWMQDVPDQKAIVSQYCRYTAEVKTGLNIKQMINRGIQIARSQPQGPVYLCASREVLEQEMEPYQVKQRQWQPVELGGLPEHAAADVAEALAGAKNPLLITGYGGRRHEVPGALAKLADAVPALRVIDAGGSDMSFPANHPAWLGLRYAVDGSVAEADVIVVLDCDMPWVPTLGKPNADAQIFQIDVDPLKPSMQLYYFEAEGRYRADTLTAVQQITRALQEHGPAVDALGNPTQTEAGEQRRASYEKRIAHIDKTSVPHEDGTFGAGYLARVLKTLVPENTIYAVEAVTTTTAIHDALQLSLPGTYLNCGGTGLGWSGGATLGIKLATDAEAGGFNKGQFVVQIVGDGTYMFSVPSSVYWIAGRYDIPVLTIVLNNKGWHAPRRSLLLVHPDGPASRATNADVHIALDPPPDYAGIAQAASHGKIHALRVGRAEALEDVLREAVEKVKAGTAAVVDCTIR
ncbi:thiamine pyrophosphate enzyme, N-terminal TPP binding domain-containing protein [Emericellopsis atlantica]|uniref:Thiamine pyrophosphate enzyme, N-terminal TPP binding domain-containing protein n=1 Tax=Emericellopsis atlantica TaxID=2614577 RepID=A0A9P7ZXA6_9HYPO|nr:thiamine pyrophosphate enzyme, N-terminal TPP binding domain-containing protein [Emericellopsis atlantica]KAG9259038.1 thiamine pyrophosphate enzyme, N-terminal TPP binding domain-containing protein [Emericellopsis atlantica]